MIKYRLRFKYQKETDPEKDRENNLNEILSDIDSIESDNPIRKPLDGEIIIISQQEYKVCSTSISFEKEGEVTYYDFIVLLQRNIKYVPFSDSSDYEERLRKYFKELIPKQKEQKDISEDYILKRYFKEIPNQKKFIDYNSLL